MGSDSIRIRILGGGGQLGRSCIEQFSENPIFSVVGHTRQTCDITDRQDLERLFEEDFDFCINCAAYTAVDAAEENPDLAFRVNSTSVEYLATLCAIRNVKLIHFSSDYVYHSEPIHPLKETTPCEPKSIYARSKLAGEEHIRNILKEHLILRTSWLYAADGHNFVNTMLRLAESRDELNIVDDQRGCPTYCPDIASAVSRIILQMNEMHEHELYGIYNLANSDHTSWCGFAEKIFELCEKNIVCNPISTAEFGAPAPRPLNSVLDLKKIKNAFDIRPRSWNEALRDCLLLKKCV